MSISDTSGLKFALNAGFYSTIETDTALMNSTLTVEASVWTHLTVSYEWGAGSFCSRSRWSKLKFWLFCSSLSSDELKIYKVTEQSRKRHRDDVYYIIVVFLFPRMESWLTHKLSPWHSRPPPLSSSQEWAVLPFLSHLAFLVVPHNSPLSPRSLSLRRTVSKAQWPKLPSSLLSWVGRNPVLSFNWIISWSWWSLNSSPHLVSDLQRTLFQLLFTPQTLPPSLQWPHLF